MKSNREMINLLPEMMNPLPEGNALIVHLPPLTVFQGTRW